MKDVHVERLGDSPWPSRIWIVWNALIEDAGAAQRERAVHDVRMPRDPADVGHAPVNVFGMNVLVVLGSSGDVGEIAARAVLASFRLAGRAAGVHQEERGFGIHRNGIA